MSTKEPEIEEEEEESLPFKYSITSYGADYPIDSLVKRIANNSIHVPKFQRGYVWTLVQASKFIESLLLGLPVPGVFLSKEKNTQKLLVIDGQQRLRTLEFFYNGIFSNTGKEFSLRSVQKRFVGLTYKTLSIEDRRQLDDSIVHATVIKQDEPSDDESSIYQIFERLNSGGTRLLPQEIRACVYHGELIEKLKDLNKNAAWRNIYGNESKNMRDQELILRFLALYKFSDEYEKPMKGFINNYTGKNRNFEIQPLSEVEQIFIKTIELLNESNYPSIFRPKHQLNAAIFDSVMVGLARRLQRGPITKKDQVPERYTTLLKDENFTKLTESGTTDVESIKQRLRLATDAFSTVE